MSQFKYLFLLFVTFIGILVFAQSDENGVKDDPAKRKGAFPPPKFPPIPNDGIPPGFESVLPEEVIKQLRDLHANTDLSFSEKREKFNDIMNTVPGDILVKLPSPPGIDLLPENVKEKISQIHTNVSLTWNKKHKLIGDLIESLPEGERLPFPPRPPHRGRNPAPFPPTPPPGFEKVLPKEIYQQLLKIHGDPQLSPKEKIAQIDQIMRSQPKEIIEKLPLPPGFDKLRPDLLEKARAIFSNTSLDYEAKNKAIIRFVKSLPDDQRALVRPPLPPSLDALSQKIKDDIDAVFLNEELSEEERDAQFFQIIGSLPEAQRKKVDAELSGFQDRGPRPPPPFAGDRVRHLNKA